MMFSMELPLVLLFIFSIRHFYIVLALVDVDLITHGTVQVASDEINDNDNDNENIFDELNILLVKIGGSSITYKSEFERLDTEALSWFVSAVAKSTSEYFLAPMGDEEHKYECPSADTTSKKIGLVIIHGAGSFGHFTAKEYGLKGQSIAPPQQQQKPLSNVTTWELSQTRRQKHGLAKTRL
jgi:hypothetical protein